MRRDLRHAGIGRLEGHVGRVQNHALLVGEIADRDDLRRTTKGQARLACLEVEAHQRRSTDIDGDRGPSRNLQAVVGFELEVGGSAETRGRDERVTVWPSGFERRRTADSAPSRWK